jgi:pimeloyl-ACP methyl ester carboxylesterase
MAIKTIVLVHGAFADGSCWTKVIPLLTKRGLKAIAVQNPLSSLADDVTAAHRVIGMQEGPVLLVGHSWGARPSLAPIGRWGAVPPHTAVAKPLWQA